MKILILEASPNLKGSTHLLASSFASGAIESGHDVEIVNLTRLNIRPCLGCLHCGYEGPCVQKDDMEGLKKKILASEMIVLATPLYYYGMSAQLKTVIDRFCSFNSSLQARHLKSALLSVAWNSDSWTFEALESHYITLVRYLNFTDMGSILGKGCGTLSMTSSSIYPSLAHGLGRSLKAFN